MHQKNVPPEMRELSNQMGYWFETKTVFDEEMPLSYLPPRQRKELLSAVRRS